MTDQGQVHGLKETSEMIEGVKHAFVFGKGVRDIVKDGVDKNDIFPAFELLKKQIDKADIYKDAIKDAKLIKDELKDLSKEELLEVIFKLADAVAEVEKA